jgi:hypothetical protein
VNRVDISREEIGDWMRGEVFAFPRVLD